MLQLCSILKTIQGQVVIKVDRHQARLLTASKVMGLQTMVSVV